MADLIYNELFFNSIDEPSKRSADIVAPIVFEIIQPQSVVDVGCGVGTWLAAFSKLGVKDILGIDGDYVDRKKLHIPEKDFRGMDLSKPCSIDGKFDLAISLEVAEHIPESSAGMFIDLITSLAPIVFFSAAVPGQGGRSHLNEQWPDYWSRLFADRGYTLADIVRPKIWNLPEVEPWYSQNAFLYIHKDAAPQYPDVLSSSGTAAELPLRIIHPELFRRFVSLEYIHGGQLVSELAARLKRKIFRIK